MTADNEVWNPAMNNVRTFENEVLKPVLPHARFASSFMMGSPDEAPNTFEGKLSSENLFKDSVYEYQGDGKFLHFTNLTGLKAILDSGWLRMSEFGNLLDKSELSYADFIFDSDPFYKLSSEELESLKENVFCLSACQANDDTRRNSYMWDVYGDKGMGVTIEYSFDQKHSNRYVIGKTQYGDEGLAPLKTLKVLASEFRSKNNNFFPNNYAELITELRAFHKAKRFMVEEEVRLFLRADKQSHEEHKHISIYKDLAYGQNVKYFNKLFLKGRHEFLTEENIKEHGIDTILNVTPQIVIDRITFGFNIPIKQKIDLCYFFSKLRKKHYYSYELWHMDADERIMKFR
jgi:hypothetical protein